MLLPLPTTVHLDLSRTSQKIGARQSATFDYRLTSDQKPIAVHFDVVLTGAHTNQGIQVQLHLSAHTVYWCEKKKGCRASLIAASLGDKL